MAMHCTFLTCVLLTMAMPVGAHGAKQNVRLVRSEVLSVDADSSLSPFQAAEDTTEEAAEEAAAEDAAAAKKKVVVKPTFQYYKAAGSRNCPQGEMVDSAEECKIAGQALNYPYKKAVSDATTRPAGCFWDKNGGSYFNQELQAIASWGGAGAICKKAAAPITTEKEIPEGSSNEGCNGRVGQTNGPFTCEGKENFACVNLGYVIRHACQGCTARGFMNSGEEAQCRAIAQGGQTSKGVKLTCATREERTREGKGASTCVETYVNPKSGWTDLGKNADKICRCVKRFVNQCKRGGLNCVLDKVDKCPNVCKRFKKRFKDARGSTLIEDSSIVKGRKTWESRKTSLQNASASMMSLDSTVSGKCAW